MNRGGGGWGGDSEKDTVTNQKLVSALSMLSLSMYPSFFSPLESNRKITFRMAGFQPIINEKNYLNTNECLIMGLMN